MIEIVPFKPEHMVNIEKADIDADIMVFLGDIDLRAAGYARGGPAITMLSDEIVLAVGGVIQFWKGVGEAWMMVAPEGRKKSLSLYRYMDEFINICFLKYSFHRIQTSIVFGHNEAHKCIMRLGFMPEGMMVNYGPQKENYVRYVRFSARS